MQTIIWAIGSMVVLSLIITFLPLGYTIKGKLLLVLTSFILSLGGLAAVSIFPLWQTSLMLFALIFFVAYFMNNRMGKVIIQEHPVLVEQMDEEYENSETFYEIENLKDVNLVRIDDKLPLPDSSYLNLEKDKLTELIPSHLLSKIEDSTANEQESIDMDISFLLERDTEVDVEPRIDDKNMENDYLSDIESLLELESSTELVDSLEGRQKF
jgi:Na+(H+)/acetate symporter ActP